MTGGSNHLGVTFAMYAGRTVVVLGLGRSGMATARALKQGGAQVLCQDDAAAAREQAVAAGFDLLPGPGDALPASCAALIAAPGVPLHHPAPHPLIAWARSAGVPVLGDIALLLRACPDARMIGITGTNGKSTTTALLAHILAQGSGLQVACGGNLGQPVADLPVLGADGIYVLELSSYQLDLLDMGGIDLAVLLNISPDHLARHGGMAGYIAAKSRIFAQPGDGIAPGGLALIGMDDAPCRELAAALSAPAEKQEQGQAPGHARKIIPFSASTVAAGGVYAEGGALIDDLDGAARPLLPLAQCPTLPGCHNHQNAAAAAAAARMVGVAGADIADGLRSYPGLPHRQETVAQLGPVRCINDSKATNADAAARALACYRDIYWIAGGQAKEGGFDVLTPYLDRVRHVFLIGEAALAMEDFLQGQVPTTRCGDLSHAVAQAAALAQAEAVAGAVILLSPACASFDQFADFEARGRAFTRLIRQLVASASAPASAAPAPPAARLGEAAC